MTYIVVLCAIEHHGGDVALHENCNTYKAASRGTPLVSHDSFIAEKSDCQDSVERV